MNDYIAYLQLEREEIIHGGPGSGRYPLGSGERPNQHRGRKKAKIPKAGILTTFKMKREQQKENKRNEEKREAAKEEVKRREVQNLEIKKAMSTGDVVLASKLIPYMTNEQINAVIKRAELQKRIDSLKQDELNKAFKTLDSVTKNMNIAADFVTVSTRIYNQAASIYNATPSGKDSPLAIVGNSSGGKKKNKK